MIVAQEKQDYGSRYYDPVRENRKRKSRRLLIPSGRVLMLCGIVLLCFTLAIFVSLYFANLVKLGYDLGNLEKELALLEKENQVLANSVAEFTSLECIETIAYQELGMVKPGSDDVIFVPLGLAYSNSDEAIDGEQDQGSRGENTLIAENTISQADREGKSWIIQAFADLVARSGFQQPEVKGEA
ncbi:MAG TPA: hypothetical protein VFD15_05355 [Clostridia bacterium]|nr:hypothetical protein [Clostridia bacterium]